LRVVGIAWKFSNLFFHSWHILGTESRMSTVRLEVMYSNRSRAVQKRTIHS